jgi:hypothetical protein
MDWAASLQLASLSSERDRLARGTRRQKMRKRILGLGVGMALAVSMLSATSAAAADASLNVVHGIPGVDVDVCVNGGVAISDFNPGEVVTGVPLPAGSYDFKIVVAGDTCDDTAVLEANGVALESGKNYTAIAHLDEAGTPTIGLFTNNVKPLAKGESRLTVRHTAAAPEVDVWANGAVLLQDVTNGASATMRVPTGVYAAWVSLPGDFAPVIGPEVLKLQKGTAYQVYAWGSGAAGYDLAVVALAVGTK